MLKVKAHRQEPGCCGPACLKMILHYYGIEKSEKELAKLTACKPSCGTSAESIVEAAKKIGFDAFI